MQVGADEKSRRRKHKTLQQIFVYSSARSHAMDTISNQLTQINPFFPKKASHDTWRRRAQEFAPTTNRTFDISFFIFHTHAFPSQHTMAHEHAANYNIITSKHVSGSWHTKKTKENQRKAETKLRQTRQNKKKEKNHTEDRKTRRKIKRRNYQRCVRFKIMEHSSPEQKREEGKKQTPLKMKE
jgi:hypothetical protein